MEEFLLKREGLAKAKEEQWEQTRWLAFITIKPHLKDQNAKIDQVFPKAGQKTPKQNAKELRDRILAAAELSKN